MIFIEILLFTAPTEDLTGFSDSYSVERLSEFSSTLVSSVHTTPENNPNKQTKYVDDGAIPSTSGAPPATRPNPQSKRKDLTLLMKSKGKGTYHTQKDSLYFRRDGTSNQDHTKKE